jgi:FkbM family methyltransferase
MLRTNGFEGLIMDLGVSEGNDTAYYLAKGFQVVAVEADSGMCQRLRTRFAGEIKGGALQVLNFAAGESFGEIVEIFSHKVYQGLSGKEKRGDVSNDYVSYSVPTIDWSTLLAQAGLPRYLKIDIEGSEAAFMRSMRSQSTPDRLPEFVSVECYKFEPLQALHRLGYQRFKLVDQNPPGGFQLPAHQVEGRPLQSANFTHCSGPFGLDVFGTGGWLRFDALHTAWTAAMPDFARTWYDCHAWKPN